MSKQVMHGMELNPESPGIQTTLLKLQLEPLAYF